MIWIFLWFVVIWLVIGGAFYVGAVVMEDITERDGFSLTRKPSDAKLASILLGPIFIISYLFSELMDKLESFRR